jgi:hypothetical protein
MTDTLSKEQFVEMLRPLAEALRAVDVGSADASQQAENVAAFGGDVIAAIRAAAMGHKDSDWLMPREAGGVRFGRVAKELCGYSVDCVYMSGPGPRHRHPNGEIDLCFATKGEARFDGQPEGWVVYGEGSEHVPTVTDGEMLILYFLPGGAIEFLG